MPELVPPKVSLADLMAKLDVQVQDAQTKEKLLNEAQKVLADAQKAYNDSVAKVEEYGSELNTRLGSLFSKDSRVRKAG